MSRMASKLVYVFLVTYVEEEWSKYRQEIEDVELTVSNFTVRYYGIPLGPSWLNIIMHRAKMRYSDIMRWRWGDSAMTTMR